MIDFIKGISVESFHLFIDMTPYILLGMVLAGVLSAFVSKKFISSHIGADNFYSVVKASLFGVPLPLCSCGIIPAVSYIKKAGSSRPAVVSFLISTPQTGIDSIVATYGMMGPFFAVVRPVAAFVTGLWGGFLSLFFSGKNNPEKRSEEETGEESCCSTHDHEAHNPETAGFRAKLGKVYNFAFVEFLDDIALQFVIGIIAAGIISITVPDDFFHGSVFSSGLPGMLLMVLIGMPLYICSTSSIPVALTLIAKGISPGVAYVFLIAGPAANAASLSILVKLIGKRQTAIFLFSVITGSIAAGYLIDFAASVAVILPERVLVRGAVEAESGSLVFLSYLAAGFFALLLAAAFYRKVARAFSRGGSRVHTHVHASKESCGSSCGCGHGVMSAGNECACMDD